MKRIRADGFPNLIIALTGNALEDDVRAFYAAGYYTDATCTVYFYCFCTAIDTKLVS